MSNKVNKIEDVKVVAQEAKVESTTSEIKTEEKEPKKKENWFVGGIKTAGSFIWNNRKAIGGFLLGALAALGGVAAAKRLTANDDDTDTDTEEEKEPLRLYGDGDVEDTEDSAYNEENETYGETDEEVS